MVIGTAAAKTKEAFKIIHMANAVEDQLNWQGVAAYSKAFLLAALSSKLAVTVGTLQSVWSIVCKLPEKEGEESVAINETAEGSAEEGMGMLIIQD